MEHDDALDAFNTAIAAEILDGGEPGLAEAEYLRHAAAGFVAVERAKAEAASHITCPPDTRTYDVIIHVVGEDGIASIHHLEPGVAAHCTLRALQHDPSLQALGVLGIWQDPDQEPEPEVTEAGGVTVTSEVPGVRATFDGEIEKQQRRPWWRRRRTA